MMNFLSVRRVLVGFMMSFLCFSVVLAEEKQADSLKPKAASTTEEKSTAVEDSSEQTYLLRYRLEPGETIRWQVTLRKTVKATIGETTQKVETIDRSVNLWKVEKVADDGTAIFTQQIDEVDMWQKMSGQDEVRYNSKKDQKPPMVYESIAKQIGRPRARFHMDPQGNVVEREQLLPGPGQNQAQITIPFPKKPIAVGHTWSYPHEIRVPLENGGTKKIQLQQSFTLRKVKTGIATIDVSTQILTPMNDPSLESKLIEHYGEGWVRFDLARGRLIDEQKDLDKTVVGFHTPESSLQQRSRTTQKILK